MELYRSGSVSPTKLISMKKLILFFAVTLLFAFSTISFAQTVTFTMDNVSPFNGGAIVTSTETVGGVTYTITINSNGQSIGTDDIAAGDRVIFLNNQTTNPVDVTISAASSPVPSFNLVSADVDAVGSGTFEFTNDAGGVILSGATGGGSPLLQNLTFSMNNTGIGGFSIDASNDFVGFHNFTIEIPIAAPVDLVKFTGENTGKTTRLNWQTAQEIDNSGFDVERSTDGGLTFSAIGNVAGRGNSFVTNDYEFIDGAPASGLNYYRLKQIDFDGQFEYSGVVSVDFSGVANTTLFPNPTSNVLNLRGVQAGEGAVNLTVLSNDGKLLRAFRYDSPATQIGLDVSELKPGAYYLRVVSQNGTETQRFVKQ